MKILMGEDIPASIVLKHPTVWLVEVWYVVEYGAAGFTAHIYDKMGVFLAIEELIA